MFLRLRLFVFATERDGLDLAVRGFAGEPPFGLAVAPIIGVIRVPAGNGREARFERGHQIGSGGRRTVRPPAPG